MLISADDKFHISMEDAGEKDVCEYLYGIDISKGVTPEIVRDAIINCFTEAHEEVLEMMKEYHEFESDEEFEGMKNLNVHYLIKNKIEEVGGDFDNPTKEDLVKLIETLAEYAKNFRNPEIIGKHKDEIMALIERL